MTLMRYFKTYFPLKNVSPTSCFICFLLINVGVEEPNYVTFWAACMADVAKLITDSKAKATFSSLVFLSRKSPSILLFTCQKKISLVISDLWLVGSIQNIVISASLIKCFRSTTLSILALHFPIPLALFVVGV